MNKKDIAEIKRRLHPERSGVTCIRGCYVNSQGEVISAFTRSLAGMAQEEAEKYLAIFKRTLSGTQGQNLIDIDQWFPRASAADRPQGYGPAGRRNGGSLFPADHR